MPAQAVLGSRASCQTHFPEREGDSLELPLPGLWDHGSQPPQHPREHRAQQATTRRGFPYLCPLDGASAQSWEAASSFNGLFARLDWCDSKTARIFLCKDALERDNNN